MPQLTNSNQQQGSIDSTAPQWGALLQTLLSKTANPNEPAMNLGPSTLQGIGSAGKTSQEAIGPYQQGVIKALKEHGYNHATEAIQSGVDPMEVQNHEIMGQQQSPIDLLATLISSGSQQAPQNNNITQKSNQLNQQQNQGGFTQEQLSSVQPASTPLGKLLESVGFGTQTKKQLLENMMNLQKVQGQEPIQPYQQLQQNVELAKNKATYNAQMLTNIAGQENKISEQYMKDFEPLKLATDSIGKITSLYEDSVKNPNNNVNDFFLVYNAIKAADPNSVKEGEYKTVQSLMPLASKVLNGINFQVKGETLTPAQRARIVKAAVTQYNGLAKRFEPLSKEYENRITKYGGNPERALVNYGAQGKKSTYKVTPIEE